MISQKHFQQFQCINERTILVDIGCFYNIQDVTSIKHTTMSNYYI
jgi:hypothetical protein